MASANLGPNGAWRARCSLMGSRIAERLDHKPRLGRDGYEFLPGRG